MPTHPVFDRSNGWWSIRIRNRWGARRKIQLRKDPRWRKGGNWPPANRAPRCPAEVEVLARPFQDQDASTRLGIEMSIPRATSQDAFLRAYAASYAIARRPESSRLLRRVIASWTVWCDSRGIQSLERVTAADCRAYLESRASSGSAYNTIRTERGLLGSAFEQAFQDCLISSNPWRRTKTPGRNESVGTPSYTADEVAQITAELHGWHRALWLVGVHSGFRCNALRGLCWGDVLWTIPGKIFGSLVCRSENSKGGKAYAVPISRPLHAALRECLLLRSAIQGSDNLLFPGRSVDGGISRPAFGAALRTACQRAGVEYRGRPWHSMRATFASLCHAQGVNPRTIQAWMNHSSIKMTDQYSHYSTILDDSESEKLS